MPHEQITIATEDGECPAHVFTPGIDHLSPAILFFMDAGGIRPIVLAMAERLSTAGYVVMVPDLFYRYGAYGPLDPKDVFKGDVGAILGPLVSTTGNAKAAVDTGRFLACMDDRPDVRRGKLGAVGFCMGGGMAIAAGGSWPDRFGAIASFHGGNLATEAPDSPHMYASRLSADVYIAAADNDDSYPPAMARRLQEALQGSRVPYTSDTYAAAHGWMMPDFPTYDAAAAEQGWRKMLSFFERSLRHGRAGG